MCGPRAVRAAASKDLPRVAAERRALRELFEEYVCQTWAAAAVVLPVMLSLLVASCGRRFRGDPRPSMALSRCLFGTEEADDRKVSRGE